MGDDTGPLLVDTRPWRSGPAITSYNEDFEEA